MAVAIGYLDAWVMDAGQHPAVSVNTNPRSIPRNVKEAEGAALKRIWDLRPPMAQAAFATTVLMASAGYLPQLFKGDTPLDLRKARLFAEYLKCRISDFSPRLAEEDERDRALVSWPFQTIKHEEISSLSAPEIAELEGKIRSYLLRLSEDPPAPGGRRAVSTKSV